MSATPGPWRWSTTGGGDGYVVLAPGFPNGLAWLDKSARMEDGLLMAAAPEMREALAIVESAERRTLDKNGADRWAVLLTPRQIEKARAALAKAEGR